MPVPLFNLAPNLTVSRLCLGTMTFGEQNSLPQSFGLLDEAFNGGINFFDSAEMYPVPQRAETQGRSEEYLGRWIKLRKIPRDRIVLATKVAGPSGQMTWIRGGPKCLDCRNITNAIDSSLKRMQVDYIDLYQIHWPDRFVCRSFFFIDILPVDVIFDSWGKGSYGFVIKYLHLLSFVPALCYSVQVIYVCFLCSYVPMFGETEYDPTRQFCSVGIEEQLDALSRAVAAGKVNDKMLSLNIHSLANMTPINIYLFVCRSDTLESVMKHHMV
ncbi:PROTEIN TAS [Salix koriyanagi]|uniref:PROTEIN TAS n=1 Tax=Salix koriyanagi TaxID=2511006 RepID=A0A9Q0SRG0_9ROSI|nr:PROTEIN TAS [Salix koriyanagi]